MSDNIGFCKVVTRRCRIFVDEHSLCNVLLVVGNPQKIFRLLSQFISCREMWRTACHLLHCRRDARLLVALGVGDNPVTLSLFDGIDHPLTILFQDGGGRIAARS